MRRCSRPWYLYGGGLQYCYLSRASLVSCLSSSSACRPLVCSRGRICMVSGERCLGWLQRRPRTRSKFFGMRRTSRTWRRPLSGPGHLRSFRLRLRFCGFQALCWLRFFCLRQLPGRAIPNISLSVCQDMHPKMSILSYATERSSLGLEDNILRYTNSFVMVDAVPAQFEPLWVMVCPAMTIRCWSYQEDNDLFFASVWGQDELNFWTCEAHS